VTIESLERYSLLGELAAHARPPQPAFPQMTDSSQTTMGA
jgi:hypothetical protein